MSAKEPSEHIWTMMQDIGLCMIVTHSGPGDSMRARPMAARAEIEHNAIYFLTDANAPKDREIAHDSNVCLTFADPKANNWVSVTGVAEVIRDPALVERIWAPSDKAYFSDAHDPNIRVIRVTPDQGEFWEGSGTIVKTVKMIAAAATGSRPDLGDNKKVAM